MQINSTRSFKKSLAFTLAVVLAVMMVPFSAFAEDFLTVTGVITSIDRDNDSFTIKTGGSVIEQAFYIKGGLNSFVNVGDTLRVYFRAEDPNTAVQATLFGVAHPQQQQPARTRHSVAGVVTDATMHSIKIYCDGAYRTFSKEDATLVGVRDGIALGDSVRITYYSDNPHVASQISMISHGRNHGDHPTADPVSNVSVTGTIIDATMNTITVSCNGKYRTFARDDAAVYADDGLLLGDTVKIVYNPHSPKRAISITMVTEGGNH